MYHDHKLRTLQQLAMENGENFTTGLRVILKLTAQDTACDIAGKGIASEASFRSAVYEAIDVYRNRERHAEATAHPLRKQYYEKRDDSDKLKLDTVDDDL